MPRGVPIDLVGQQYGSWTILAKIGKSHNNKILWLCRCACGTEAAVPTGNLRNGRSTRCRQCGSMQAVLTRWGLG